MGGNELAVSGFGQLAQLESLDDVKAALKQLGVLKAALEAADRFRYESVKYARYEAYALARAYELAGNADGITGKWRKLTAEWLCGLTEDERDAYVAMCSDGKTIDNIYREVVVEPMQRAAVADALSVCKKAAREKLDADGMVSVQSIVREHSDRFPRSMLKVITDGVRDAVRTAGGVGIGDDSGTYINPETESRYVSDAIATRVAAVVRDIESIADLAQRCESKPFFRIKGNGEELTFADVTYILLAGVGCAEIKFDNNTAKREARSLIGRIVGDV